MLCWSPALVSRPLLASKRLQDEWLDADCTKLVLQASHLVELIPCLAAQGEQERGAYVDQYEYDISRAL